MTFPVVRSLVVSASLLVLIGSSVVRAAPPPQPVERDGACPSGYYASDHFCVPTAGARYAVRRAGSCPSGYFASGNYCVAASDRAGTAIPRKGSCPSGYYASDQFCVSTR